MSNDSTTERLRIKKIEKNVKWENTRHIFLTVLAGVATLLNACDAIYHGVNHETKQLIISIGRVLVMTFLTIANSYDTKRIISNNKEYIKTLKE